jgi:hypothetical protein
MAIFSATDRAFTNRTERRIPPGNIDTLLDSLELSALP